MLQAVLYTSNRVHLRELESSQTPFPPPERAAVEKKCTIPAARSLSSLETLGPYADYTKCLQLLFRCYSGSLYIPQHDELSTASRAIIFP